MISIVIVIVVVTVAVIVVIVPFFRLLAVFNFVLHVVSIHLSFAVSSVLHDLNDTHTSAASPDNTNLVVNNPPSSFLFSITQDNSTDRY